MAERPTLITIIGVLTVLMALLLVLAGIGLLIMPDSAIHDLWIEVNLADVTYDTFVSAVGLVGIVLIVAALIEFVVGYALLKGWTIAWYLGVISYALSIIISLITIMTIVTVLSLVISLVILYYLFRPNVKEFFGV